MLGSPTEEEMNFLLSHVKNKKVFEWGSGRSTIEIGKIAKSLTSIEHNWKWFKNTNNKIRNISVDLNLVHPNGKVTVPAKKTSFKDYISVIDDYDKFDVIFVDGRARKWCAEQAITHLKKGGFLFIHDWGHAKDNPNDKRPRYEYVLKYYDLVDVVGTMAKLKVIK